jgi:hypothetical protein
MRLRVFVVLLCLLPTPARATPFDFSRPYAWDWRDDGPILLDSIHAAGLQGRIALRPDDPRPWDTPFLFSPPELPPVTVGQELPWGAFARLQDGCEVGPFCQPIARFTLVGETGGWALKGFRESPDPPLSHTPEPGTLLLVGSSLTGLGLWWRRRRARGGPPA